MRTSILFQCVIVSQIAQSISDNLNCQYVLSYRRHPPITIMGTHHLEEIIESVQWSFAPTRCMFARQLNLQIGKNSIYVLINLQNIHNYMLWLEAFNNLSGFMISLISVENRIIAQAQMTIELTVYMFSNYDIKLLIITSPLPAKCIFVTWTLLMHWTKLITGHYLKNLLIGMYLLQLLGFYVHATLLTV